MVLLSGSPVDAQTPQQSSSPIAVPQRSVAEIIKRSVVFIQTDCAKLDEQGKTSPDIHGDPVVGQSFAGTAFLIGVTDSRLPADREFSYLVTNRHVALPGSEDGKPCQVVAYHIQADRKSPNEAGSFLDMSTIPQKAMSWTLSADASDDLAVAPIRLANDSLDLVLMPSELLLSKNDVEANQVQEGDSVLFAGLFVQMVGLVHQEPIIREGNIAMMPKEKMPTTINKTAGDIYLVDCHVFGGNSGSPMFIDLAGMRLGKMSIGYNYKILGVVSGYVTETSGFQLQPVASYAGTVEANSGVTIVVPAQKIIDLIYSPELTAARDREFPAQQAESAKH